MAMLLKVVHYQCFPQDFRNVEGLINTHKHYVIVCACIHTPFYERVQGYCAWSANVRSLYTAITSLAWLGIQNYLHLG